MSDTDQLLHDLVERLKAEGYPARSPVLLTEAFSTVLVPFMAYVMDRLEASA